MVVVDRRGQGEGEWASVSITSVTNLVRHGCRDHSPADPPIRPSVDDLATALADLAPFRVTSSPKDVRIDGYRGKHLELSVPDMAVEDRGDVTFYTGCTGYDWHRRLLMSWIAPHLVARGGYDYYGYPGPGTTEEFWDPRRRRQSPGDRGRPVRGLAPEGPGRAADRPRLDPDQAMKVLEDGSIRT